MDIDKITVLCFSPTGGTKKYLINIAQRLCSEYQFIDLTKPSERCKSYEFGEKDLVIFGAPVYAGRLPIIEGGIFDKIKGKNTPAIFNVSYGNRDFDDALLEEKNICEQNGFVGIAAAAWIAPHTFSEKIASGRPDSKDMRFIDDFAEGIKKVLKKDISKISELYVLGNSNYKAVKPMPFSPKGSKKCSKCNVCVEVCPVGAISKEKTYITDSKKCIACFACVKNCPDKVRNISNPLFNAVINKLEKNLIDTRKEPELFYVV